MNIRMPSTHTLAISSGAAAVIFFVLMLILLHFGHSEVSTTQGVATSDGTYATAPALGIISSLFAFLFGLIALLSAVACVVFLRRHKKQSDQ